MFLMAQVRGKSHIRDSETDRSCWVRFMSFLHVGASKKSLHLLLNTTNRVQYPIFNWHEPSSKHCSVPTHTLFLGFSWNAILMVLISISSVVFCLILDTYLLNWGQKYSRTVSGIWLENSQPSALFTFNVRQLHNCTDLWEEQQIPV